MKNPIKTHLSSPSLQFNIKNFIVLKVLKNAYKINKGADDAI